jgi:hypothetical protein
MKTNDESKAFADNVYRLAVAFADNIRAACVDDLESVFETIRERNQSPEYLGKPHCATQDFFDANMGMFAAFVSTIGREPDIQNDTDVDLWNAAWNFARSTSLV